MTDTTIRHHAPAPAPAPSTRFNAEASLFQTIRHLWPYIWPGDRTDLKLRVGGALLLLFVAKFVTIAVPYSFKWATDSITGTVGRNDIPSVLFGPIALTILYGALRAVMQLFTQGRDALFAAVAMNAVRRLANEVFVHMHRLSLRFHLERKTGGLTRVLERGRTAIETIVRMTMMTAVPTIVEFMLIIGVFLFNFDWRYVLILLIMIAVYLLFTTIATNWRIGLRRAMNESDTDANTKAIDSLLNYETVKYFGAEKREASRYDVAMERYERTSVSSYVSLAVLNTGQGFIFSMGLMAVMILCVQGIRAGHNTIGDFVLVNAMMIQLYQPLNFM
ncbi:MAG TPA: ABC transporter transmembrane domain-containing protein, partial [Beijerinckiaceae bacterium]|nr:ABC transporter transmembrane domain-containing protein [Beijerinckiaceae bacterium]